MINALQIRHLFPNCSDSAQHLTVVIPHVTSSIRVNCVYCRDHVSGVHRGAQTPVWCTEYYSSRVLVVSGQPVLPVDPSTHDRTLNTDRKWGGL